MENLFLYLIKSSGLIAVFYLAYHFSLRKETFFNNNRWFLLSGLLTSATLPLFFIEKVIQFEKPKLTVEDLMAMSNHKVSNPVITQPIVESINWIELAGYAYGIIVIVLIAKVLTNIVSLFKLLHNQKIERQNNFALVDLKEDIAPFSFFNFIVFNSSLYSNDELESILLHEKVHSQQKHSIDVLIAKLFCIFLWFNPFVWLYKKAIVQNLEYIADNKAIQLIEDKKAYQKALLKVVSHQNCLPITNHFYQSLIKKRIVMLNKNQSNKRNSWKYTVVLPALIAFVFLFQVKVVAQEKSVKTEVNEVKSYNVTTIRWDKDTPNDELNSDIKFIKERGVTLKYSNLKRNNNGEIVAIKVDYKDTEGNSGTLKFDSNKPIKPIQFYKTDDSVGFGDPSNVVNSDGENDYEVVMGNPLKVSGSNQNDVIIEVPEPPTPPNSKKIEKTIIIKKNGSDDKEPIIFINGQKYDKKALDELDPTYIETVDVLKDESATKIYGKDGENGVIVVRTKTIKKNTDNSDVKKPVIFSNDNGDDIVLTDNYKLLKLPGSPAIHFNYDSPILIVNGNVQSNPGATMEIIDVTKIKSVRIYDENGNESKGTPVKKVVITTK